MPNFGSGQSSPDSASPTTPRNVPLVNLAGSPTSKRRNQTSVSSRQTPRRPDRTPVSHADGGSPVWVPSSAPTRLANGYRQRSGSPSNSFETELSPIVPSNKPFVYNGQFPHSRVAALQSQGRALVCLHSAQPVHLSV